MATSNTMEESKISITPLLKRLWHESAATKPNAVEIAAAVSHIFTNSLSEVQTGALLTCLHFTERDRQADVLSKCAEAMRTFATDINTEGIEKTLAQRGKKEGSYQGGLVCTYHSLIATLSVV
jgi:anthranilate phosphoribosyltransferase